MEQVLEPRFAAQPQVVRAFLAMRAAAALDGFDLHPFSTFRDYDTQLRIWNNKFSGKRPLYDKDGAVRDHALLSPAEIVDCILNWSALPGGSRHHWGTEIDVIDARAMPEGYSPKLLPEETAVGGIFRNLHSWLDQNMARFDFFRPYNYFLGGMFPEPWHLSYAPAALQAIECINLDVLTRVTSQAELLGKDLALARMEHIYRTHILTIVGPDVQQPVVGST